MDYMSIVLMLMLGAIAGIIASLIIQTPQGLLMDMLLGIAGAFSGSLVMSAVGQGSTSTLDLYNLYVVIMGSILMIGVHRMFFKTRLYY
jgi:uncharacterized membrane protein YeaQ/YmgE (transglycosylase-associated protein family)